MKPPTEKPSDGVMRFFTPELYGRYNSADDSTADAADEEWEVASGRYMQHLDALRDQMPSQVRTLAELCLHDAEVLAVEETIEPVNSQSSTGFPLWTAVAIVSLQQGDEILSVIYVLADRVREHASAADWPFETDRPLWLYDEIDLVPGSRGTFLHRVLLSDGRVIEVPFVSVLLHRLHVPLAVHGETSQPVI